MPGKTTWNNSAAQRDNLTAGFDAAESQVSIGKPSAFMVTLTSKEGREVYANITKKGELVVWDVKLKRQLSSHYVGASGLTAVNSWLHPNQFILASSAKGMMTIKVFEEEKGLVSLSEMKFDSSCEVRKHRRCSLHMRRGSFDAAAAEKDRSALSRLGDFAPANKRGPVARAVFHVRNSQAAVVLEPMDAESGPTGMLVDMDEGTVLDLDVYGEGPKRFHAEGDEDSEDSDEEHAEQPKVDKLVQVRLIERTKAGRTHTALVCLYDSNRLVQTTLHDGRPHEIMLLEENPSERSRNDSPICFNIMPNSSSGGYHFVVSYQSMTMRWWLVTGDKHKLQSHVMMNAPVTHLVLFEWPSSEQSANTAANRKSPVNARRAARASKLAPLTQACKAFEQGAKARKSTVQMLLDKAKEDVAAAAAAAEAAKDSKAPGKESRRTSLAPLGSLSPAASIGIASVVSAFKSRASSKAGERRTGMDRQSTATGLALPNQSKEEFLPNDHARICAVAFDVSGGMPILFARAGRIAKVYTCADHFVDKSSKVDQLLCDGSIIAAQMSNGDIKHLEFVFEEDMIPLKQVPFDLDSSQASKT